MIENVPRLATTNLEIRFGSKVKTLLQTDHRRSWMINDMDLSKFFGKSEKLPINSNYHVPGIASGQYSTKSSLLPTNPPHLNHKKHHHDHHLKSSKKKKNTK